jgi:hypothetical protein
MPVPDNPLPQSSIILYQIEDGRTRIQCWFEDDAIWLSRRNLRRGEVDRGVNL